MHYIPVDCERLLPRNKPSASALEEGWLTVKWRLTVKFTLQSNGKTSVQTVCLAYDVDRHSGLYHSAFACTGELQLLTQFGKALYLNSRE